MDVVLIPQTVVENIQKFIEVLHEQARDLANKIDTLQYNAVIENRKLDTEEVTAINQYIECLQENNIEIQNLSKSIELLAPYTEVVS